MTGFGKLNWQVCETVGMGEWGLYLTGVEVWGGTRR